MEGMIRLATSDDADAVTVLRQAAYSSSHEFTLLSASSLAWGPDDELGVVLVAVTTDGTIVSTMRSRLFATKEVFERISGLDLSAVELPVHTMFLDRASTHEKAKQNGLNTALRYHFLQNAAKHGLPSVSGWLFSDVSRTRTMKEIGYNFISVRPVQPRGYRHMESKDRDFVVAVLTLAQFPGACLRLEQQVGDVLRHWRWEGPSIRLPGVVT